jgi:predicted nucleic acid-binding protein
MSEPLLDTNVILRLLLRDHPEHSPQAKTFFDRLGRGEISVQITVPVLFETVFILEKHYQFPRPDILERLLNLLALPGLHMRGKTMFSDVFLLWAGGKKLSFIDAYHAVLARKAARGVVVSFDTDFDGLPGITRVEPAELDSPDKAA